MPKNYKLMKKIITSILLILLTFSVVSAQKKKPSVKPTIKNTIGAETPKLPIILAVLNDGTTLDPIAFVNKGKLSEVDGTDGKAFKTFLTDNYYKFGSMYRLIFGGSDAGKVTVTERGDGECTGNLATGSVDSDKAKLKGMVMALATDLIGAKNGAGVRRLPTPAERSEIEKLVKAEFAKQNNTAKVIQTMKYQNLTALDVDNDGTMEMVGSFWVSPTSKTRNLLFFIAEKNGGSYGFAYKSYEAYTTKEIMSGEAKDLDGGMLHELLLDVFDYDGDGKSEIFTIGQAFEGNNFYVYKKTAGKWKQVFKSYSYRCGY